MHPTNDVFFPEVGSKVSGVRSCCVKTFFFNEFAIDFCWTFQNNPGSLDKQPWQPRISTNKTYNNYHFGKIIFEGLGCCLRFFLLQTLTSENNLGGFNPSEKYCHGSQIELFPKVGKNVEINSAKTRCQVNRMFILIKKSMII